MRDLFEGIPAKWIGYCAKCGRDGLKKNMMTLSVRDGGNAPQRVLCNLCPECMATVLDELGVAMPKGSARGERVCEKRGRVETRPYEAPIGGGLCRERAGQPRHGYP